MECPECKAFMEQICMYGTEEEINIDYHCENCGCIATLKWIPCKKTKDTESLLDY